MSNAAEELAQKAAELDEKKSVSMFTKAKEGAKEYGAKALDTLDSTSGTILVTTGAVSVGFLALDLIMSMGVGAIAAYALLAVGALTIHYINVCVKRGAIYNPFAVLVKA